MSLTSEVQNPDSFVRKFIDREFPHLKNLSAEITKELKAYRNLEYPKYSDTYAYTLVGTATDYRIRFLYTRDAHKSVTIEQGLKKLQYLYSYEFEGREYINKLSNLDAGYTLLDDFYRQSLPLISKSDEEALCRFCIFLAKIDHFRRGTSIFHFHEAMITGVFDLEKQIESAEKVWVDDVRQMAANYRETNAAALSRKLKVRHGSVLAGSTDIGGADLDLVVDGCLVEIKTTIKPKTSTNLLRQIIGYWLLDYNDQFKIKSARIDFIRQNHQVLLAEDIFLGNSRSKKAIRSEFMAALRSRHS